MSGRYTGPLRVIFRNNPEVAQQYISVARVFLQMAINRTGEDQAYWVRTLPDGTTITVMSDRYIKTAIIDPMVEEYQSEIGFQGILMTPESDDNVLGVRGWGFPYVDGNGEYINFPLGTLAGDKPEVIVHDGQIKRSDEWYLMTDDNDILAGELDWQGYHTEPDGSQTELVLTYSGRGRYYNKKTDLSYFIYRHGVQLCRSPTTDWEIRGVGKFGDFLVIACGLETCATDYSVAGIRFYARNYLHDEDYVNDNAYNSSTNPNGWRQIGDIDLLAAAGLSTIDEGLTGSVTMGPDISGSAFNFNQSGNRCVWVPSEGGKLFEFTISGSDIESLSASMSTYSHTPNYRNARAVGTSDDIYQREDLVTDGGSGNGTFIGWGSHPNNPIEIDPIIQNVYEFDWQYTLDAEQTLTRNNIDPVIFTADYVGDIMTVATIDCNGGAVSTHHIYGENARTSVTQVRGAPWFGDPGEEPTSAPSHDNNSSTTGNRSDYRTNHQIVNDTVKLYIDGNEILTLSHRSYDMLETFDQVWPNGFWQELTGPHDPGPSNTWEVDYTLIYHRRNIEAMDLRKGMIVCSVDIAEDNARTLGYEVYMDKSLILFDVSDTVDTSITTKIVTEDFTKFFQAYWPSEYFFFWYGIGTWTWDAQPFDLNITHACEWTEWHEIYNGSVANISYALEVLQELHSRWWIYKNDLFPGQGTIDMEIYSGAYPRLYSADIQLDSVHPAVHDITYAVRFDEWAYSLETSDDHFGPDTDIFVSNYSDGNLDQITEIQGSNPRYENMRVL